MLNVTYNAIAETAILPHSDQIKAYKQEIKELEADKETLYKVLNVAERIGGERQDTIVNLLNEIRGMRIADESADEEAEFMRHKLDVSHEENNSLRDEIYELRNSLSV